LTLIPIRLDLDINSFTPAPALPLPSDHHVYQINPQLPAYKQPEPTLPFRLKDTFLWNLHETLITPDQFATILIHDLDLPQSTGLALEISKEIRTQLEQYAGVALHPLFHTTNHTATNGTTTQSVQASDSREQSATPQHAPMANGATQTTGATQTNGAIQINGHASPSKDLTKNITAKARSIPTVPSDSFDNPDDTYRCIITLSIHLQNRLFTDRFEWSLLHPPGSAERFARQTCADLSLAGEWVPAMTHAIYEAVLKLKKEACESGGLIAGNGEIDNLAVNGEAGWRFDDETLADEWAPRLEKLSKEELEKREGDRERQIRRLRRETARFSSTANMMGGMPTPGQHGGGYFEQPVDSAETPMGRGERSKKKRRFRSLSPLGREGTPGGRGTPGLAAAGYGGGGGLTDFERQNWRCAWCKIYGNAVWAVRDGPAGPRVSLILSPSADCGRRCAQISGLTFGCRVSATTAGWSTRETSGSRRGRRICIIPMCRLRVDDRYP